MNMPMPRLPIFCLSILVIFVLQLALFAGIMEQRDKVLLSYRAAGDMVMLMGLSDLALSTEARYTRHPAVSDEVVPFMDHPGALEHFPSGSFFKPVRP